MKSITRVCCISVAVWMLAGVCHAEPLYSKDVLCDDVKCGTMEIDTYGNEFKNTAGAANKWTGGVEIDGQFKPMKARTYHYVQAIKTESDTFRWISDTSVPYPQPFLDVPPGGHKVRTTAGGATFSSQSFDYLPWYDEGTEFPDFYDKPSDYLLLAKSEGDKKLEWAFETWLVCVINDQHDGDTEVKDDSYKIAPLLGWQWGYDVTYNDVGTVGTDEAGDFTVTKRTFAWVTTPSADWTNALGAKYGKDATEDNWNITTGACEECGKPIPEPSTSCLVVLGLAIASCLRSGRGNT